MKSYPRNPRTLTKKRAGELESSLARLGDLGGIVHNLTDDTIVGGNQRMRIFGERTDTVIVAQNDEPDQQGTVAHGFIVWQGNRYAYRQVKWDEATAREANIRANLQAGEWDWQELAAWDAGELQAWGFDDERLREWNNDAMNLREMGQSESEIDPNEEWAGMPTDESINILGTVIQCIVRFTTDEARKEFEKFIGFKMYKKGEKTYSLWYPPKDWNQTGKGIIFSNES